MVHGDVADLPVAANQEAALPVDVQRGQCLFPLERVQTPPPLRLSRFGWFGVLDHHPVDGVGLLRQFAGEAKVGLLLLLGRPLLLLVGLLVPLSAAAPLKLTVVVVFSVISGKRREKEI